MVELLLLLQVVIAVMGQVIGFVFIFSGAYKRNGQMGTACDCRP
jgi:hypothetical protein